MPTWSGFWNVIYTDGYALYSKPNSRIRRAMSIAERESKRAPYNRIMRALAGVAPGGTALGQYARVAVQDITDFTSLGGYRPRETQTVINRVTTAADVTNMQKDLDFNYTAPWPVDKGGNGGGGKGGL